MLRTDILQYLRYRYGYSTKFLNFDDGLESLPRVPTGWIGYLQLCAQCALCFKVWDLQCVASYNV